MGVLVIWEFVGYGFRLLSLDRRVSDYGGLRFRALGFGFGFGVFLLLRLMI